MAPRPSCTAAPLVRVALVLTVVSVALAACSDGPDRSSVPTVSHGSDRSAGCGQRTLPPGGVKGRAMTLSLDVGATQGTYDLVVPRTYRPGHPVPLILAFYGFASDPAQFVTLTQLPSRGSADGDMVVVPHIQRGESEWQLSAHGTDAAFVDELVTSLDASYCIDRAAVFAAGFSAGAAFAVIYSCARQAVVAAIATVAVEFQLGCTRPMSILAFHGTADPLVPYQNGAMGLSLPGVKVSGTERNMGEWARLDHCRPGAHRTRVGTQVVRQQWAGCSGGSSVVLYTVLGGGHSWPGGNPALAVGLTTQQVSATSQILSFFSHAHR